MTGSDVDALGFDERRLMDRLCAIERESASDGERMAAEMIVDAFREVGAEARIETDRVNGRGYWLPIGLLAALSAAVAGLVLAGRRAAALLLGLFTTPTMFDDLDGGSRWWRHAVVPKLTTWHVVARVGNPAARSKLVVLGHHDAPHTGVVFHPRPQHWVWERNPSLIENTNRSIPFWAPVALAPAVGTLAAIIGSRRLARLGLLMSGTTVAALVNIAFSRVVPGANDNASGSVGLVMAARELVADPPGDLDVWLVSCGSEEQMQEGIRAFMERHRHELPVEDTWFVNLETIGSPQLVLLEGEGTVINRDFDRDFTSRVDAIARDHGIGVRRGLRAGASTDSITVHRMGYRVATLTSVTEWKALSNYHWPSDVPGHLDWGTISSAVGVAVAVARFLDRR